ALARALGADRARRRYGAARSRPRGRRPARGLARPLGARRRRRSRPYRPGFRGLRCAVRLAAVRRRGAPQLARQGGVRGAMTIAQVEALAAGGAGAPPTFGEAFKVWLKISCLSFGGPVGQIALMHRILVDEKKWIDEARFLHALNFCMLLPGPEAQQLATYIGWLLHGTRGALTAGILFLLPGAFGVLRLTLPSP